MAADPTEESALAAAFRAGDEAALRAMYDRWGGIVLRFCTRLLGSASDAEDVTQQVFVSAWRSRASYDPARAALPAWLLGIAKHKIVDRQRAIARQPTPVADPPEALTGLFEVDEMAERLLVADAMKRLPPEQRSALELAFFEGCSHQEVALRLGLPLGTAKSHIRRGLEGLRRVLPRPDEWGAA